MRFCRLAFRYPPFQFDGVVLPGFSPCSVCLKPWFLAVGWLAHILFFLVGAFALLGKWALSDVPAHCIFSNFACLVFSLPIGIAKC